MAGLLDAYGRPVRQDKLKDEIAAASIGGVRSPLTAYPADGMTPLSLAGILRAADAGDPVAYLELAETIEERDPHYVGVLGTRRRSVSQIAITVEAGSDSPEDEAIAQEVRDWMKRDELTEEMFDILDCIGKGYSFTEIIWDTSEGQWMPSRLEWRDPRWFRFAQHDMKTPLMLDDAGAQIPLEPFKFIHAQIKAKSGIALRSGLARVAAWGWMFKAFTQRDWAIFSQTYGQPVRLGKYATGASEDDKATLFRAVANIAGDCAAIIPESMAIEFVESGNVGSAHQLYKERADWLDQQISKAVLGQTSTTDAVVGGLGSGKEHRAVQKDIETADARALAAILNRDLIRPWVQLNHGPQKQYPRLKLEQEEQEDLKALADALSPMIDRGLKVSQSEIRSRFGVAEPEPDAELMAPQGAAAPVTDPNAPPSEIKRVSGVFKRGLALPGAEVAPQAEGLSTGLPAAPVQVEPAQALADRLAIEAAPAVGDMVAQIEAMLEAAGSMDEFRAMLTAAFPKISSAMLATVLGKALVTAEAVGRLEAASGD